MSKLQRRDFLKLSGAFSAALALSPILSGRMHAKDTSRPNIIIILFDAMSAKNLSVYGYPRNTTPNFERFASRATVYHSHQSAGNFTVPGTASLLTGTYPWTHRAVNQSAPIARRLEKHNIFHLFGKAYNRYAFSQNVWANVFLNQFHQDIDVHLKPSSFSAASMFMGEDFEHDLSGSFNSLDNALFTVDSPPAASIFGTVQRLWYLRRLKYAQGKDYPRGLPGLVDYPLYFRLEEVFKGVGAVCETLSEPWFAYFHLWSPHEPYRPHIKFSNYFKDDLSFPAKPHHRLGDQTPDERLAILRRHYDDYIANVDFEFGRLLDKLEESGILDKSYVIVTSDHGQMMERGVHGHVTPLLYDPILRVPLLISAPGQNERNDVYTSTSSTDLLPTLLRVAGIENPGWCEGAFLPGFGGNETDQRSIFSVEAKESTAFAPFRKATVAMIKGGHKLIYYTGYEKDDTYELYDIETDPDEMNNLYTGSAELSANMRDELISAFYQADPR